MCRQCLEESTYRFSYAVSLPQGVIQSTLFPQQQKCSMCVVFLPKEVHQRLSTQRLYRGLVTQVHSAYYIPKFQTPKRNTNISRKSYLRNLGTVILKPSRQFSADYWGYSASQVPSHQPKATLQEFLKVTVSGMLCELFCTSGVISYCFRISFCTLPPSPSKHLAMVDKT